MKLAVGFGTLLLVLVAVGILGYVSLREMAEFSATAADKDRAVIIFRNVEARINDQKSEVRGFLLDNSRQEEIERYANNSRILADDFSKLESLVITEKGRQMLAQLREGWEGYDRVMKQVIELQRSGKTREAVQLLYQPQTVALRDQMAKAIAALVERGEQIATSTRRDEKAAQSRAATLLLAFVITGLIVGLAMNIYIARNITGRVFQMVAMIEAIAGNDLSREDMTIRNRDEIGRAGTLLNGMKNNLRQIMQSIAATAEQVASASEQISASAAEMANGGETQRDQVHQVATAMQEMAATVHEVSENCNKASESAHKASQTAHEGGVIVQDTLTLMRSIADSVRDSAKSVQELGSRSDQIGKIVGVIDDIADQTNLLALNAAIEAARAGEQGRGFAVVADEVRKLAERTTKATKEIAEMILSVQTETRGAVDKMQSGTRQVEKGVEVTAKAGTSLKQIIGQAEHVGEMVTQIATAANEQSSATEHVNNNMEQINKLVAESAEGARQSSQACEQLSSLAFELQNLVSRFQLGQPTVSNYRWRQAVADPDRVRTAFALAPRPPVQHVLQDSGHGRNG